MVMADVNGADLRTKLQALLERIAFEMDSCDDPRLIPQLARQYRETAKALDEIPATEADELEGLLDGCEAVR